MMMYSETADAVVVSLQGIGNTVMALYALERFMRDCSRRICLIVPNDGSGELAHLVTSADRVYLWDTQKSSVGNVLTIGLRLMGQSFDSAYAMFPAGRRETVVGLLPRVVSQRVITGAPGGWTVLRRFYTSVVCHPADMHDINSNLAVLGMGRHEYVESGHLLRKEIRERCQHVANAFICENRLSDHLLIGIHAGARGAGKRWPAEKYIDLCRQLRSRLKCKCVIVGGDDEQSLKREIAEAIGVDAVCVYKTSITETAAILDRCNLFIGNDSAPMHLAWLMQVPVIAIWGYTDYRRTAPYGPGNIVVRRHCPCGPCYRVNDTFREECDFNLECIRKIPVEAIVTIVERYMDFLQYQHRRLCPSDLAAVNGCGVERVETLEHGCMVVDL